MKSLGSYTLGDQYVSPERRLSAMLTQQGSKGGPSNSWQETMGRIAQQLAGAYIGYKDTQNRNKAFDAQTGLEPDSTSMKQTYTPDEVQGFASKLYGGVSDSFEPSQSDMNEARLDSFIAPTLNETAGNVRPQVNPIQEESFGPQQAQAPQPRINGSGWDRSGEMPDFSGVHQLNSRAGIPQADPRQEAVNLMQRNQTEQLNEKMNPRDYSMQQLRGLENNPYAKRILAQMMMQNADMDYERGLAKTQRGYVDSDYKRKRKDDIEDRNFLAENKLAVKNAGSGTGPFSGSGMEAQKFNVLLKGDPSSPVYRAAYNDMAKPKTTFDTNTNQMISVTPDMSAFRPPTGSATGQAPQSQAPQGQAPQSQKSGQPTVSYGEGRGRTKPYPEFQSKSAGFYNRMMDANKEIDNIFSGQDGVQGTSDDLKSEDVYNWKEFGLSKIPGGNAMNSDEFQRVQQAQANWVTANLRLESGAAIPPEEQAAEFRKYFPVFGDSDAVIAQKARARKQVEKNMVTQSQGAYESMYGAGSKPDSASGTPSLPPGFVKD